jgi:hypothetical protein
MRAKAVALLGPEGVERPRAHPRKIIIFAMAVKTPTLADAQCLLPKAVFLPIPNGAKGPEHLKGWTKLSFAQTQNADYQATLRRYPVTGVLLGRASGDLCTIDCDTEPLLEAMLALNPRLAQTLRTRGQSGGQLWVYIPGARPHKVWGLIVSKDSPLARGARSEPDENGRVEIGEFRAEGGQSVIAGPHKDTGLPYTWPVANPPIPIRFDEILWPAEVAIPWEEKRKTTTDVGDPSLLKRAIERLTVDALWDHFGYGGRETNPVTSPWHSEDVDTSFSIYDLGKRFKDHDPGRPNERGDSFDFFCRATGKSPKGAFEEFVTLAGLGDELRKKHETSEEWNARRTRENREKAQTEAQAEAEEEIPDWLRPRPVGVLTDYLPPQIISGVLYQSCRFVIGGGPKSKKSWFLMLLCYSVANGLPFLGFPTQKGRAVYLNFELLEGDCKQRSLEIQHAVGAGDLDNLEVIQLRGKRRFLSNVRLNQLTELIVEAAFVLCGFDPIYKLLKGRDERLGVDVDPVLDTLEAISETAQCSVGFAQHYAKGNQALKFAIDRISGSNYFARDTDVLFTLTDLKDRDTFVVDIIQRSFPEVPPFGVRFEFPLFVRDPSLDITAIRQPGQEKKPDPLTERMLAALHAADAEGGLTFTDWLRAVQVEGKGGKPTPSKSTFQRRLDVFKKRGGLVFLSVATNKYGLTPEYAARRAKFTDTESEEGSSQ